ncbi:MAG: biotin synthase [Oscillospiraceae bacterium]|nr:biotin synthase [Oscillospiraceae bacterium]
MANVQLKPELTAEDKFSLMEEDGRFEVTEPAAPVYEQTQMTLSSPKATRRPPPPKVFLSNDCVFNCSYCGCRCGREEKKRYTNTPRELARLAVESAHANGGSVFITSAVVKNPDYTEELMIEAMRIMRGELGYRGTLHAKVMPGADPGLIRQAGSYANQLSVNIEVAKSEGYKAIARDKNRTSILRPMTEISRLIREAKAEKSPHKPRFAVSQTTQLMAGSTGEDDLTILNLSSALYGKYGLQWIYYTPYQYLQQARGYEERPEVSTPGWRMTRLYQADRLMQLYGFTPGEITPESAPNLTNDFDPKASWALRNLHLFPVEVNTAPYEMLIRIPGIGITTAKRILDERRLGRVTHDVLRRMKVPLKRSRHFLTADGKFEGERGSGKTMFAEALRSPLDTTVISSGCI